MAIRTPLTLMDLSELPVKSEHFGKRIATPVCGLVRNDRFIDKLPEGQCPSPTLHSAF